MGLNNALCYNPALTCFITSNFGCAENKCRCFYPYIWNEVTKSCNQCDPKEPYIYNNNQKACGLYCLFLKKIFNFNVKVRQIENLESGLHI